MLGQPLIGRLERVLGRIQEPLRRLRCRRAPLLATCPGLCFGATMTRIIN
jgi:hypothetical protein